MIVPHDSLLSLVNSFASVVDYHLLIDKLLTIPCLNSTYIYSHGLDCSGSLGLFMKTLVPHLWTKLHKIMFYLCTRLPRSLKTHSCILWLRSTFLIYMVLYDVLKYCKGASVPIN